MRKLTLFILSVLTMLVALRFSAVIFKSASGHEDIVEGTYVVLSGTI